MSETPENHKERKISMIITLEELTINDKKVQGYLLAYLERMSRYDHFDEDMLLQVYVNKDNDFTAFEAKDYRLQFTSSAHKLVETIRSNKMLEYVSYNDFLNRVREIQLQSA